MDDVAALVENSTSVIQAYGMYERKAAYESLDDQAPSVLWHYTTTAAMQQILESGRLWATNAEFMNDSTEFAYGRDLLIGEVCRFLDNPPEGYEPEDLEVIDLAMRRIRMDEHGWQVYLICFCQEGDLLSQWRGYGSVAVPVALGVDLTPYIKADQVAALDDEGGIRQVVRLHRVRYSPDEQRNAVHRVLDIWMRARAAFRDVLSFEDGEEPTLAMLGLEALLENLLVQFKHAAFAEEREWRLTCSLYEVSDEQMNLVRFTSAYFGPKPYISLAIPETKSIDGVDIRYDLPLRTVRVGPTAHAEIATRAMEVLLHTKHYYEVELSQSEVPLR